jgi:isoleucyl-tRNA synthetase
MCTRAGPSRDCCGGSQVVSADPQQLADVKDLETYVRSELNIGAVKFDTDDGTWSVNTLMPNFRALGKKLGKDMPKVKKAIMSLDQNAIEAFVKTGQLTVEGCALLVHAVMTVGVVPRTLALRCAQCLVGALRRYTLSSEEVEVKKNFKGESDTMKGSMAENGCLVLLNTELDDALLARGLVREFVNRVQKMRKTGGLAAADKIEVFYEVLPSTKPTAKSAKGKGKGKGKGKAQVPQQPLAEKVIKDLGNDIGVALNTPPPTPMDLLPSYAVKVAEDTVEVDGVNFRFALTRLAVGFKSAELLKLCKDDKDLADDCVQLLSTMDYPRLKSKSEGKSVIDVKIAIGDSNEVVSLTVGREVFWSMSEAAL